MPYPKKHLNPGETIALDLHPHWWFFAKAAAAVVLSIVAISVIKIMLDDGSVEDFFSWVGIGAIVIAALWLLIRYMKWVNTNFVITSDRIIFRHGVIGKSGIEMPLERVNNVNFHQTAFERLIGAGDLLIESGGEDGQQRFTDVRKPQRVQNLIHAQVEAKLKHRSGYAGGQPGFAPPQVDVPGQLEKLEGLLQRGSLTQEEFDAQKQRLLGG